MLSPPSLQCHEKVAEQYARDSLPVHFACLGGHRERDVELAAENAAAIPKQGIV